MTDKKERFGWVRTIRESKKHLFVTVFDGNEAYQCTIDPAEKPEELKVGASILCEGVDSKSPKGDYEFLVSSVRVIGKSDDSYPIQPKIHTHDFLRTIPELRGKTRTFQNVWKVRDEASQLIHKFMHQEGFRQFWTPIMTQADCEGAGETFDIKTDWMEASLTVSGQLHGEVGAMSMGKIYTFSPCFRAEKSNTKKHLSEFWMIEPEMVLFNLHQTMDFSERMIKYVMQTLLSEQKYAHDEFNFPKREELERVANTPWVTLRYDEVITKYNISFGEDIGSETEKAIVEDHDNLPVFITHYPKSLKPFYMATDGEFAECFDLIFPTVGELVGGSVRETDHDLLEQRMILHGIDVEQMRWYLATRKYGTIPHAGFGMGFERLIMYLLDLQKIHDAIPFPVSA